MLEIGIDEITLVLQLPDDKKAMCTAFTWADAAETIIDQFARKSNLVGVFGEYAPEQHAPQGYTTAYTFGEHAFYFSAAYHDTEKNMGVVVKFSAQSLEYYCEATGQQVYEFLQKAADPASYNMRLSRIDIAADYIDEGLNVTEIYQALTERKVGIFRERVCPKSGELSYRRCEMQISGFAKDGDIPTVYLGSVQSDSRLRIYDKRREQFERDGPKLDKAKSCQDWVRFEGVFKRELAHQLSAALMRVQDNSEFSDLLASALVQKFRLMYIEHGVVDCETEYTQMLIDCIGTNSLVLKSPSSRNFELAKSIRYMLDGSGVMTTLYKINQIWPDSGLSILSDLINEYLTNWQPNDDCRYWLAKNQKDYQKNYPDFNSFIAQNVLPTLRQL